eukprot:1494220-Prymnesium_polylepis.1
MSRMPRSRASRYEESHSGGASAEIGVRFIERRCGRRAEYDCSTLAAKPMLRSRRRADEKPAIFL